MAFLFLYFVNITDVETLATDFLTDDDIIDQVSTKYESEVQTEKEKEYDNFTAFLKLGLTEKTLSLQFQSYVTIIPKAWMV